MSHHIALFQFRLGKGQSIGPSALRRVWSLACGSEDVTVSREARRDTFGVESHSYFLCAPPKTANLLELEARLRRLLGESVVGASVTIMRVL